MEQRAIKFRAWDLEKKRWVRELPFTILTHTNRDALFSLTEGNIAWLQFTGLTNNGQEWYDGDILANDSDWYQIGWSRGEARWGAFGIRFTHEILALSELLSQETWVQGNVFENPELLSA